MYRPIHRRKAVTLIEMLLVMAILVLLAGAVIPSMSAFYGDIRIKAAADQVRAAWTEARAHAIESGQPYRFAVQPGTGNYKIAPDNEEFWSGGSTTPASDDDSPPFISEAELSSGITFNFEDGSSSGGEWSTVVVFNPDGSCQTDREITLTHAEDENSIVIHVRAMTGAISIRKKATQ